MPRLYRLHRQPPNVPRQDAKAEARRSRAADRVALAKVARGMDPDNLILWTKKQHVSDVWNWD